MAQASSPPPSRTDTERGELTQGLQAEQAAKAGTGFVELDATFNPDEVAGRIEAGLKPFRDTAIFAFAQASSLSGLGAGVGARWDFDL